ncbi:hypothetical protein N7504_007448 [Penicillium tannophilum]|nr:hypothetical protein N7504_007448 [Penicillium tannophilum]
MAATWGKITFGCAKRSGRPIHTLNTMCASIEEAGFVQVHEKGYKLPLGLWAKDEDSKETGTFNHHIWSSGLYMASHYFRSPSSVALRTGPCTKGLGEKPGGAYLKIKSEQSHPVHIGGRQSILLVELSQSASLIYHLHVKNSCKVYRLHLV